MGIRGLNKLINHYAENSLNEKNISKYCGSKIAIDSEILIYKFRCKEDGKTVGDNSHIYGFISNIFWYLKNGITPIYIFDGIPCIAKIENAISKRQNQKERMNERIEELETIFLEQVEDIEKYTHESEEGASALSPEINDTLDQLFKLRRRLTLSTITKNHKNECRYLLKLMGIPFINATEDAEALCVALQHNKLVEYVYTEDTDALTYAAALLGDNIPDEGPIILRKGKSINTVIEVDLSKVLKGLELTPKEFVEMCILSGCDFCSGIPKIGPMKSYNYIKKYRTINNFLKESGVESPEDFTYTIAKNIFYKDHMQEITKSLEIGVLNTEDLKKYLTKERRLNPIPIISGYHAHVKSFKTKITEQTLSLFDN